VRRQEESAAEALDLERALRLRVDALPEPVPADDRERPHDQEDDAGEREQRPSDVPPPDREAEDGKERGRVDLGGHGETEQPESERRTLVEQRAESGGDEERRPDVVGVERNGPEGEGRERQGRKRTVETACARSQPDEDGSRDDDRREAEHGHEHLERVPVGVVRQERGRREDREGAGRILDEDVPVRDTSVQQAARVLAVEADVAVLAPAKETALGNRGRDQVDRRYERSGSERRPELRASAPSSNAAEILVREHQARVRIPTSQGWLALVRRRVCSGAA
jgi:hypothetical protein